MKIMSADTARHHTKMFNIRQKLAKIKATRDAIAVAIKQACHSGEGGIEYLCCGSISTDIADELCQLGYDVEVDWKDDETPNQHTIRVSWVE